MLIQHKPRRDRAAVDCPRQRILAGYIQEIEDLFSSSFVSIPPGERLTAQAGKASTAAARFRNSVRMMALGAVVRLGLDIGLSTHSLHGHKYGNTEVIELLPLHYQTTQSACALFDALLADEGELAYFIEGRFADIRQRALAEVARLRHPVVKRHNKGRTMGGKGKPKQSKPEVHRPANTRDDKAAAA